jgi:hypothetical protein
MDLSYFETLNEAGEVVVNRPETKSLADLERVIALNKPISVVERFAEMVAVSEQWAWYDLYQQYRIDVIEHDELVNNHVIEYDEDGVEIEWLAPMPPVETTRPVLVTTEQLLASAKGHSALVKNRGVELLGKTISLNESNQNGIAAVLTGLSLAESVGADMFPLSFKAETLSGVVSMPFADLAAFKGFALQFMGARQAFFK